MSRPLDKLNFAELTGELRALLFEEPTASVRIDRRAAELPYHPLLRDYERGEDDFRDRVQRATRVLLERALHEPWPTTPFNYLLTFLARGRVVDAVPDLEPVANSRRLLASEPDGHFRQMLVLRTLLGLGWKGAPAYWQELSEDFTAEYPELIFKGLANHSLDAAFDELPRLATSEASMERLLDLFPSLIETHGLSRVAVRLNRVFSLMAAEARGIVFAWMEQRGYPKPVETGQERREVSAEGSDEKSSSDAVPSSQDDLAALADRLSKIRASIKALDRQMESIGMALPDSRSSAKTA